MDLVSIVIPAYNVEDYVEECVNSILKQTYTEYEVIIIDDGSSDNTYKICKELASKNPKVYIYQQENQGVSSARNKGLEVAKGNFIVFVDADDIVSPYYVEVLVKLASQGDLGMVGYTSEFEKLENKERNKIICENTKSIIDDILCGKKYDGYLWNKIFKQSIIKKEQIKFKQNITIWEDLLFVLEYLYYSSSAIISGSKLYYYRYRKSSAVNSMELDKYKSKYEIISEIKKSEFTQNNLCKNKIKKLYYELTLSYCNQLLICNQDSNEVNTILDTIIVKDLISCKKTIFIIKYIYLRVKCNQFF